MKKSKIIAGALVACLAVGAGATMAACKEDKNIYVTNATELVTAVEEAKAGDKIVLKNDIVVDSPVEFDKKLTLDLNGKKISNTDDIWNEDAGDWALISVRADGELTITGNGTVEAKENDCYAADVQEGGKLIIKDSKFVGNVSSVYVHTGELVVDGGTFEINQLSEHSDYRYVLNCFDASYEAEIAKITVNGGTFENFNPDNNLSEGAETDYLAEGYTAALVEGYYVVSKA